MADKVVPLPGAKDSEIKQEQPLFTWLEPIRVALEMQREAIFDAMPFVSAMASAIEQEYNCDKIGHAHFDPALRVVYRMLDEAALRVDPEWLEDFASEDKQVCEEIEDRTRNDD